MKKYLKHIYILLLFVIFTFCNGQNKTSLDSSRSETKINPAGQAKVITTTSSKIYGPDPDPALQISQYIRRIFQDRNGNIWFGTNGDGVCRYDPGGKSLVYFTMKEGFGGSAVRGIVEDERGDVWFATDGGVSRYNANYANHPCNKNSCNHILRKEEDLKEHNRERSKSFTNFTMQDGLSNNQVWSILKDKNGNLWFGTEGGVSRYVPSAASSIGNKTFSNFYIPVPDLTNFPNAYPAPKLINCIFQDKAGIIWFASNGGGVYSYDPSAKLTGSKALTNISEKDSLCNNFVQSVLEDKEGKLWFGSRFGGASRYNSSAKKISSFEFDSPDGQHRNFVWTMLEDKAGNIWFGTAGDGGFFYSGKNLSDGQLELVHFGKKEGITNHVQSILEDKNGNFWFGCSGGLFRLDPKSFSAGKFVFINVTKNGPWP